MKIQREDRGDGHVTLTVDADGEEMAQAFEIGLAAFIEQFDLSSLEGEGPEDKIRNAIPNTADAQEAIANAVMGYLVPMVLKQEQIVPLSSAATSYKQAPEAGKPFTFTMDVLPKPSFELSDYSTFTVEVPAPPQVTDEDIDAQIHLLAKEIAEERHDPASGTELVIPAVTQTWVEENLAPMGIRTLEELRETFRTNSEAALQARYQEAVIEALMDVYFKRFTGTITDDMIEAATTDMVEGFIAELAQQGIVFEEYLEQQSMTEDDVRSALAEQAKIQLIQGLILDAIFTHEKLKIDIPDLMAMVHTMAPGNEEAAYDLMEKTGRTFLLREGAQRQKALAWILENNTIVSA